MKLIIKQPIDKKEWSTVFCVGTNACEKGGQLSNTVLEKMRSDGIIQEIDPVKVIDNYFKHVELITHVKSHNYYEIIK